MSDLRVELLAVEGCPHFEATRRNLETILREGIIETPIQVIFVGTRADAEFLGFPGSPTVRVNGEDVVPQPGLPVGLGCRIYRDVAGALLDGPPVERMREVIQAHRRAKLDAFQQNEARTAAAFARAASEEEAASETAADTSIEADRTGDAGSGDPTGRHDHEPGGER